MKNEEIMLGMPVRVISGDHEGRGGRVIHLDYPKAFYNDEPELYAIVEYKEKNEVDGTERMDQIALPVRRLAKSG